MYHIHGFNMSFNTTKVLYVAEALDVDYVYTALDPSRGEHQSPEHLKRHPMGKTPTLDHDGKCLFESATICRYLANVEKSPLYPAGDHYQRAVIEQWMDFFANHAGRWLGTLLFERVARAQFGMGEKNADVEQEALGFLEGQLRCVDDQLAANPYLAGDTLSIADSFAFAYAETAPVCDFSLDPYPNIARWLSDYQSNDSVARARQQIRR